MKKILSLLLAVIMAFSIPCTAFAAEATPEGEIISTFIGEDGYEYEYIRLHTPMTDRHIHCWQLFEENRATIT